jgi:hypothetical protein
LPSFRPDVEPQLVDAKTQRALNVGHEERRPRVPAMKGPLADSRLGHIQILIRFACPFSPAPCPARGSSTVLSAPKERPDFIVIAQEVHKQISGSV